MVWCPSLPPHLNMMVLLSSIKLSPASAFFLSLFKNVIKMIHPDSSKMASSAARTSLLILWDMKPCKCSATAPDTINASTTMNLFSHGLILLPCVTKLNYLRIYSSLRKGKMSLKIYLLSFSCIFTWEINQYKDFFFPLASVQIICGLIKT